MSNSDVIFFHNNEFQSVSFMALDRSGIQQLVKVEGKGKVEWPKLTTYGPDVESLIRRKVLVIRS